jgi:hypothetical protein
MAPQSTALRVRIATTRGNRLRGLIGRSRLEPGHGLLLSPARSVHTCFMRFPVDVVFLDRDLAVLGVARAVVPWRLRGRRGARAVLELAAGEAERTGIGAGDRLFLQPCAACCSSSSRC